MAPFCALASVTRQKSAGEDTCDVFRQLRSINAVVKCVKVKLPHAGVVEAKGREDQDAVRRGYYFNPTCFASDVSLPLAERVLFTHL
jgi:hypothetical protein